MASGIDAVEKSIDYYAETLEPAILLILNESSIILLPRLRKTISSAENHLGGAPPKWLYFSRPAKLCLKVSCASAFFFG
jgi:hypothetical protein